MSLGFLLIALFLLSVIYLASRSSSCNDRKLPPGLSGLGVIPLLVHMARQGTHAAHCYMIQKYGDIASARIFQFRTLTFIGNHALMRETYTKHEFTDRPNTMTEYALVPPNDHLWREQNRFALTTRSTQEELIQRECAQLVNEMANHEDSFETKFYIGCAVTNVICATIFSERFQYGDPFLTEFLRLVNDNLTSPIRRLTLLLPFIKALPGVKRHFDQIRDNRETVSNIVRGYIASHKRKATYLEGNNWDYIDAYLAAMHREQDTAFTECELIASVHDVFVAAGSEMTGTTLRWGLAFMAQNPEVQQKVHDEIDAQIGRDRLPKSADKHKMPFTEAVLLEIQRYGTIVPVVAHLAVTDTTLADYVIKKGSIALVNVMQLNRDRRIWPYPDEFNVKNFIDEDGGIINRNYFVAYSVGKRSCLGESLAKMETFLFFVCLMQKLKFYFAKGEEPDLTKANEGIIRAPPDYHTRCINRFQGP